MNRIDADKVSFVFNALGGTESSITEDYGLDFYRGDEYWEVKSNNKRFADAGYWFGSKNVSTLYAPPIEVSVDELPKYPAPDYDLLDRHEGKEKKRFGRYTAINAEKYSGLTETRNCKLWKMVHYENTCLAVLYNDGILTFNHKQLFDALSFYAWVRTTKDKEYGSKGKSYWQLKVFIDMEKGTFIPMEVPKELFRNDEDNIQNIQV